MRAKMNDYSILVEKPERKRTPGRPTRNKGKGKWIILKLILERWDGVVWTEMI
jgi:hypothetical protein